MAKKTSAAAAAKTTTKEAPVIALAAEPTAEPETKQPERVQGDIEKCIRKGIAPWKILAANGIISPEKVVQTSGLPKLKWEGERLTVYVSPCITIEVKLVDSYCNCIATLYYLGTSLPSYVCGNLQDFTEVLVLSLLLANEHYVNVTAKMKG